MGVNDDQYKKIVDKYNILQSDPRPGVIRYFKDVTTPLVSNSDEVIK